MERGEDFAAQAEQGLGPGSLVRDRDAAQASEFPDREAQLQQQEQGIGGLSQYAAHLEQRRQISGFREWANRRGGQKFPNR